MQKSLYEQLRDADSDMRSRKPDATWDDKCNKQMEGRVSSAVQPVAEINKRLTIYQKAINEIDDYFEYRYAQFDREEIRKYVYGVLDSLAKKFEVTKSV